MELFHNAALTQCNSVDLLWYRSWVMNFLPIHSCLHVTALQPCSSRNPLEFTFFFGWFHEAAHSTAPRPSWVARAAAPRQEWPVGAQMDFLQRASSPKEMHHGTRAVFSLFTVLPLLSDFFSSRCTWHVPGSTVTGCLSCCIYTVSRKTHLSYFGNWVEFYAVQHLYNAFLCLQLFHCPVIAPRAFYEACTSDQMLVLCQDLKFPVS